MQVSGRDDGAHGDEFTQLVHATAASLLRTAVLLCGDRHRAEDLVQTTYAKVYSKWARVSRADNPVAYTRTMLTRTYLSEQRRRSQRELPVESVWHQHDGPDTDATGRIPTRMTLMAALAELAPRDRAILVLRHWEDRSVTETAALLGISEGACRTRTTRALERLRTHLPDLED